LELAGLEAVQRQRTGCFTHTTKSPNLAQREAHLQPLEHLHQRSQELLEPQTLEPRLGVAALAEVVARLRYAQGVADLRRRRQRVATVLFMEAEEAAVRHSLARETAPPHKALLALAALVRQIVAQAAAQAVRSRLLLPLAQHQLATTHQALAALEPMVL
jgi:hypothetical protein